MFWDNYFGSGKLVATHNYIDKQRYTVTSDKPVAPGEHWVRMTFTYQGGKKPGKGGTLTLYVDRKRVGSGAVEQTTPFKYSLSESQDIGQDTGTPVTYDYQAPFPFEGEIETLLVELLD